MTNNKPYSGDQNIPDKDIVKSDNNCVINSKLNECIKNSDEVTVDINDYKLTDEIPEEIWEQESNESNKTHEPIKDIKTSEDIKDNNENSKSILIFGYKLSQLKWFNIFWLIFIHTLAIYAYIYAALVPIKLYTGIWGIAVACASGFGVSAGAHRLWAHRAFKARWGLKLILVILETMAINGSCFSYARDHRNHHKYVDTDADPKNAKRGFLYAHIGWWCLKKNPKVIEFGKKLSHYDLTEDTLIMIQHKFYYPMVIIWGILFPMLVPYYGWNEDLLTAFNTCVVLRTVFVLHHLFTVNSIAHIIGKRPYDKGIGPTESKLTMYLSLGEGSHNYHHSFPMDYANCEKKWWEVFNPSTLFIDTCEKLGLAYDLKKPSKQVIQGVIQRKGDPEYFERKLKRSVCSRIMAGIVDWVIGFFTALWPCWIVVIFKLTTLRPTFVIDENIFWP